MIRNLAILTSLLAVIGGYTWYDDYSRQRSAGSSENAKAVLQQTAPDFSFETLDGKKHSLSDFKGKAVVLNFWASWCAPCVMEFPQMVRLAKATEEQSVFLFLSLDDTDLAVQQFLKKYAPRLFGNVYIARDKDKAISQTLYQTFKLPETYLIDSNLQIRDKIVGNSVVWDSPALQQKILELR